MTLVLEFIALAALSPFLGGAFLLVKGVFERTGHQYTIDDYFDQKERSYKDLATMLHSRLEMYDEFAVLNRPEVLLDEAVATELKRRTEIGGRPASRRMTM